MLKIEDRPVSDPDKIVWYKKLVQDIFGDSAWHNDDLNVVALRGFDVVSGQNENKFNEWNDTVAFIWEESSCWKIIEKRASTDPGVKSYIDDETGNVKQVSYVAQGQREFRLYEKKFKAEKKVDAEKKVKAEKKVEKWNLAAITAPDKDLGRSLPVYIDYNMDGDVKDEKAQEIGIDGKVRKNAKGDIIRNETRTVNGATGTMIHWAIDEGGKVNGYSHGCIVLPLINKQEEIRKSNDEWEKSIKDFIDRTTDPLLFPKKKDLIKAFVENDMTVRSKLKRSVIKQYQKLKPKKKNIDFKKLTKDKWETDIVILFKKSKQYKRGGMLNDNDIVYKFTVTLIDLTKGVVQID